MWLVNEMLNIFLWEVLCGIVSKPFEKKVLQNVHNFNSAFLYMKEVLEKKMKFILMQIQNETFN